MTPATEAAIVADYGNLSLSIRSIEVRHHVTRARIYQTVRKRGLPMRHPQRVSEAPHGGATRYNYHLCRCAACVSGHAARNRRGRLAVTPEATDVAAPRPPASDRKRGRGKARAPETPLPRRCARCLAVTTEPTCPNGHPMETT